MALGNSSPNTCHHRPQTVFRGGSHSHWRTRLTVKVLLGFFGLWNHTDMQPSAALPDEPSGPSGRGAGELLLGILSGSALLPFIQAIATKAGEDVYKKISGLLSRNHQMQAVSELKESGTITLVDSECRVVLRFPAILTSDQFLKIVHIIVPRGDEWYLVDWSDEQQTWHVTSLPQWPSHGLYVGSEHW